ncbi:MAG: hypothetical protein H6R14_1882 [Proteobacteria bacterium]|nr:hypothetical protein [Pseudomonadota bacterium]
MSSKKPSPAPSGTTKPTTQPPSRKGNPGAAPNLRQQADNRWQRTKRYGWDSR